MSKRQLAPVVKEANLISNSSVEVICSGRGGEYVVYFSRHATISGGYRFKPNEAYLSDLEIPEVIRQAAIAAYAQRFEPAYRTKGPDWLAK